MTALASTRAFIRRDWAIARSYRLAYALELGTIVLSLTLFFYMGRLVDDSTLAASAGLERGYFAYAVVGVALLRVVYAGLTSFATNMRTEQTTGTFETLMATPASPAAVILGSGAYALLRAAVSAVLMLVLAAVVFGLKLDAGPGSIAFATAAFASCLALFASLGVLVAAFTVMFKQTTALLGLLTTGLGLLSGVYFPVKVLPALLQAIGHALPFTWGLDVLRRSLLHDSSDVRRLGLLLLFDALALPLSMLVFGAALRQAKRMGTLAHY